MELINILSFLSESKSPIIAGTIIVIGMFLNSKVFKAENRASMEAFKNDVTDKINGLFTGKLEDIKSVLNQHDIDLLTEKTEIKEINISLSAIRETLTFQYNKLENAISEQTKLLHEHENKLSMYDNFDCFLREIRKTVNHSLDILSEQERIIAKEYLYTVSAKVCDMVEFIHTQGLTTLSKIDFDAMTSNSIHDCKEKFSHIYGSDKTEQYFKNITAVYEYKKELFKLIEDEKVNNIERRYKTLTLKWFETLCANFIRIMYIKKGVSNGNTN